MLLISSCRQLSLPPLAGCLLMPSRHQLYRAWHQQRPKVLSGRRLQLLRLQQIAAQHSRPPHRPRLRAPLSASLAAHTMTWVGVGHGCLTPQNLLLQARSSRQGIIL